MAPSAETQRRRLVLPTQPIGVSQKVDEEGFTVVKKKCRLKLFRNSVVLLSVYCAHSASSEAYHTDLHIPSGPIHYRENHPSVCGGQEPMPDQGAGSGTRARLTEAREINFKLYILPVAAKYKNVFLK